MAVLAVFGHMSKHHFGSPSKNGLSPCFVDLLWLVVGCVFLLSVHFVVQ
jgi:hypothetical protein